MKVKLMGKKIVNILIGSVHEPENLFFGNPVCDMVNQQVVSRLKDDAIKSIAC